MTTDAERLLRTQKFQNLALNRIYKVKKTGATALSLNELHTLTHLPIELSELSNLQSLDLTDCSSLTDLGVLASLPNLQKLNMTGCSHLIDISVLAHLSNLRELSLRRCSCLNDLSALAPLSNLVSLDIGYCGRLRDLSPLAYLASLEVLDINYNSDIGDISMLSQLTKLKVLDLSYCCEGVNFQPLRPLLPGLEALYLYASHFNDLPEKHCGHDYDNVIRRVRKYFEKQDEKNSSTPKRPKHAPSVDRPTKPQQLNPMFDIGTDYTRDQIHEALGGSLQSYLPTVHGYVVCACLRIDINPQAPAVVLVGSGKRIEQAGAILASQREAIHVFLKRASNAWTYRGLFLVRDSSQLPAEIQAHAAASKDIITRVIHLQSALPP